MSFWAEIGRSDIRECEGRREVSEEVKEQRKGRGHVSWPSDMWT